MTVRVNLREGCGGFTMTDGTNYSAKPGTHVDVADEHAPFIRKQVGGDAGLVGHASFRSFMGTRDGRWCPECGFIAQKWSVTCPRCERRGVTTATIPEAEMPVREPSRMPSACLVPISPAA